MATVSLEIEAVPLSEPPLTKSNQPLARIKQYQTIYTTIIKAIKGTYQSPAIITFDLPLFIKASQIVKEQKLEVVVTLEE